MSTNPLVAGPVDTSTATAGTGLIDDVVQLCTAIQEGNWVDAALAGVATAVDALATAIDPVGTLIAWGVGWIIEHVEPLKGWLNDLTGDAGQVLGFAQTWGNIATHLSEQGTFFANRATTDLAGMYGTGLAAYVEAANGKLGTIGALAQASSAIGGGLQLAAMLVQFVHDLVRDTISQIIGSCSSALLWAATGVGIPYAISIVSSKAASLSATISAKVTGLVRSLTKLKGLFTKLDELMPALRNLARGGPSAPHVPGNPRIPDVPRSPDAPHGPHGPTSAVDAPGASRGPSESVCVGDPVDVATGRVILPATDLTLPGALPVELSRMFSSTFGGGRWFGRTWASSFDERLILAEGRVVHVRPDAGLMRFPAPTEGMPPVLPERGIRRWPLSVEGGTYRLVDPVAGHTRTFAVTTEPDVAELVGITDRQGRWTRIERDGSGAPTGVTTSGGYRVVVDTVVLPAGDRRVTRLAVDDRGTETTVSRFGYSADGLLTQVWRGDWPEPTRFGYDAGQRITSWVDTNGMRYDYTYDEHHRCVAQGAPTGELAAAYDYSGHDASTGLRVTLMTDAEGHQWRYLVDGQANVAAEIDPLGGTVLHDYDEWGQRVATTDELGHTTRTDYDELGQVVGVTYPDGTRASVERDPQSHAPVRVSAPDGRTWTYLRDAAGRVVAHTDPAGATSRITHGPDRIEVVDALGGVTVTRLDAAGLVVGATDPAGWSTQLVRDGFGRIVTAVDAAGATTTMTYAAPGRLRAVQHPDGTVESWEHDGEGNPTAHIDPSGRRTRRSYTGFDLLASQTFADGATVRFGYNRLQLLTSVTNANGGTWSYHYDAAGRLTHETDWNGRTVRYRRDAGGRVVRRDNGAGQWVEHDLDWAGRSVRETTDAGVVTELAFDAGGRLVLARGGGVDLERVHDPAGRLVAEVVDGHRLTNTYDVLGRRTSRTTPAGVRTEWDHDPTGAPVRLRSEGHVVDFSFDPVGREVCRIVDADLRLDRSHDIMGRPLAEQVDGSRGAPIRTQYGYARGGLLVSIADSRWGSVDYALDPTGRVEAVLGREGLRERYDYDGVGNIVAGHLGERFDEAPEQGRRVYHGTLLTRAGRDRFDHDGEGRVIARRRHTLSGRVDTWRYTWDVHDRLTSCVTPDGTAWSYAYDATGRRTAKRRHAPDGRVVEVVGFAWDGEQLVEQVSGHEQPTATTWDYAGGRPILQHERTIRPGAAQDEIDARFYAIVTDLVGAPTELLTGDGRSAWRQGRSLWGVPERSWGPFAPATETSIPLRFPGQYADDESGLHYNRHRYYDPTTGRFLTTDPLGLLPAPNPNAYVADPRTWSDPSGLTPCTTYTARPYASKTLAQNLADAGQPAPTTSPGWQAHHMIPGGEYAGRSASARDALHQTQNLLHQLGINLDEAANGIWLPPGWHQSIHTDRYFEYLWQSMRNATTRQEGLDILDRIGRTIGQQLTDGWLGTGPPWTF